MMVKKTNKQVFNDAGDLMDFDDDGDFEPFHVFFKDKRQIHETQRTMMSSHWNMHAGNTALLSFLWGFLKFLDPQNHGIQY